MNQWIAEQHTCETCGKVMTEKYGSGRFCCKACANTRRHSEKTKEKIANSFIWKATPLYSHYKTYSGM